MGFPSTGTRKGLQWQGLGKTPGALVGGSEDGPAAMRGGARGRRSVDRPVAAENPQFEGT
jgi:hypothetical protein